MNDDVNTHDAVRIFIITSTSPEGETEHTFCFNVKLCAISWTEYSSLLAHGNKKFISVVFGFAYRTFTYYIGNSDAGTTI